ncbi:hypothetical protein O9993_16450 [Vibrio lentus]|nr:hypothetical protein [Vibrio lentus]
MKKVLVLGRFWICWFAALPLLLEPGYQVTAAARHIDYLKHEPNLDNLTVYAAILPIKLRLKRLSLT